MSILLAVAIGGALGALARYGATVWISALFATSFPLAILLVNLSGSFLIGLAYVFFIESANVSAHWRPLLMVGFLGSFTTFSTFSLETIQLIENGAMLKALINVCASVILCALACWVGIVLARL